MTINRTFINFLVFLDCLNALGHIPIVFQLILLVFLKVLFFIFWNIKTKVKNKRWGLWKLKQELQSRKKNCGFFSLNLLIIPWDIPWHHWENLLTSKRGHSGGFNFFSKSGEISLKTSGGSRDLNFNPICKCHTISETLWCPSEAPHNLIELQGH